ncbi:M35 family metallopeptidase [Streptomyces gardneri]|uniref:M35 family metallopeptidase n=1 Tax=Streptomyces gardneri TaxID=66892 RepID=UPI0036B4A1A1
MLQNQTFECALRMQPRYLLGEPITLSFEIRNAADESYRILTWDTPLLNSPLNFLSVSREGSELPYDGPLVKRGDPSEEEYIDLAPGESRSGEIDLSQLYAIQLPGEYTVTLNAELADVYPATEGSRGARARAHHDRHALESVSVTFVVEAGAPPRMTRGQAARLAESADGSPPQLAREPFMPILLGGTPARRDDVRNAHAHAVYMTAKSLDVLRFFGPANSYYRRWFGANVKFLPVVMPMMTYDMSINTFELVRSILNVPTFPFQTYALDGGPECNNSKFAYTYHHSRTVWLCKLFWDAPLYGAPDTKYGTLIHEWTHATAGTSDPAVGTAACLNLASNNPRSAVCNGDSYEYFAEFLS